MLGRAVERIDRALATLPLESGPAHELQVARQLLESAARVAHQEIQTGVISRDGVADAVADAVVGDAAPRQSSEEYLPPMPALTLREEEVLRLVAQGLRNKEIALQLGISERTATFHVGNVLAKLGADGRVEAIHLARRRGLL